MAVEVFTFTFLVPKGGTAAAPQKFPMVFPVSIIEGVEIWVPAGSNGQLFFALGAGGTITLPTNAGAYITANNETIKWPLSHQIDSGSWQLFAYNTGSSPHQIHIRWLVTPPGLLAVPSGVTIIESLQLTGGGTFGGTGGGGSGGSGFSFAIETPLGVIDVAPGGAAQGSVLLDEIGIRPGPYHLSVTGLPAGLTVTADADATGTSFTLTATASLSLKPAAYTATVTATAGSITQQATLTVKVAKAGTGGPGGGQTPAVLTAYPSPVPVGNYLFASGSGWEPGETITIALQNQSVTAIAAGDGTFSLTFTVTASVTPGTWYLTAQSPKHFATGPAITVTSGAGGPGGVLFIPIDGGVHHVAEGQSFALVLLGGYAGFGYYVYNFDGIGGTFLKSDASGNLYYPNANGTQMFAGTKTELQFCTSANPNTAGCIRVTVVCP